MGGLSALQIHREGGDVGLDVFVRTPPGRDAGDIGMQRLNRKTQTRQRQPGGDEPLAKTRNQLLAPVAVMSRALVHDRTNALAAAAAALEVGATVDGIAAALRTYVTMPHRVALVGEANGVQWYDDSKATNPDAAKRAVSSFDSVVLLAGGRNKGLDLSVLATAASHLRGVVAFGEAGSEIAAAFARSGTRVELAADMHEAVGAARRLARPGDVVLLSPA